MRHPMPIAVRRLTHRASCLALVVALSLSTLHASEESPAARLAEIVPPAVAEYDRALTLDDRDARLEAFERAELQFRRAIEEGTRENADLWTNLGNAALGAEHLGSAIHAYRTALRLDPDHRRARGNLDHARTLLPGWVPTPEEGGALDTFLFWHQSMSPAERGVLASFSFLVAAAMLAVGIARRRAWLRNLALLPLVGWGALLATSPGFEFETDVAVVTVEDTIARVADSGSAPSKFAEHLPAGVEVTILEEREGWRRVGLADGRDAWVPAAAVVRLGSGG